MIDVDTDVVTRQIRAIVAYQFRTIPDALRADTRLVEDLGADSLDLVELVQALEAELEVTIPEDGTDDVHTLDDLERLVARSRS